MRLRRDKPETLGSIPVAARAAIAAVRRERLVAWGLDALTGHVVVAGTSQVYAVSPDGEVVTQRPWYLVDAGSWDNERCVLTVTWVDGQPKTRWQFSDPSTFPVTFRERVQASVVLADTVEVGAGKARVVIRQDLATGDLRAQTLLGRGVRREDASAMAAVEAAMDRLKEQVGMR